MESPRIYLSPPYVDQKEEDAVVLALRSGWVAPVGPNIDSFESALKNKFRYKHVLALNSGTAALHLAIKLSGVTKGDKVIIGTFTFVAAANVVLYEGGEPIFIDSEPDTWNLDPELLEERLKKGREQRESIKAVIVTHLYGMPAKMARIKKICEQFGVKLIEDAAEAVGSKIEENFVGSFGDFGILSFNGNKIVTTSGGGALICHQESDDSKARFWAQQSKDRATHYQHSEVGYNYRLSNILASIGITQLERLDDFINRKKVISAEYKSALEFFDFLEVVHGNHIRTNEGTYNT
jgi:pyridoxal phosphate-dependent aminotransferase EpsN